jgi:hypothetical protein
LRLTTSLPSPREIFALLGSSSSGATKLEDTHTPEGRNFLDRHGLLEKLKTSLEQLILERVNYGQMDRKMPEWCLKQ